MSGQQRELESCPHEASCASCYVLALRSRFQQQSFMLLVKFPQLLGLDGLNLLLVTFCMCRWQLFSAICYTNSSKLHLDNFSGIFVNDQKDGIALALKPCRDRSVSLMKSTRPSSCSKAAVRGADQCSPCAELGPFYIPPFKSFQRIKAERDFLYATCNTVQQDHKTPSWTPVSL